MLTTTTRNADLNDLVTILREQQAHKLDVVAPASQFRSRDGVLVVSGTEALLTEDGVTTADGRYVPTAVFDEGIADKLRIPLGYVRRLRAERPDVYDANVNGWLHGKSRRTVDGVRQVIHAGDDRSFLLRLFRGDGEGPGVARALVSDRYSRIENFDVLMAALDGVHRAGVEIDVVGADLSERRMYVRVAAPQVQALAPSLLRNYRSPFTGDRGADNPTVFAGFEIANSEVGGGAFTITPRLVVEVCKNGMKITKDAMRSVHLGGRMDEGVIRWTEDTQTRAAELVTAKARDAVTTFLDAEYMQRVIAQTEEQAAAPVTAPAETIKTLGKTLQYDEATINGILEHFVKGGDVTAGGVLHAVTSYAQTVADADTASDLEASAFRAMELAAR